MQRPSPTWSSTHSQFLDRGRRLGRDGGRHTHGVSVVELLADGPELSLLELADLDPAPAVGGPNDRGVHQLQDRPLAERMWDDLRPPALVQEEALKEVGGPHHPAMAEREAQVRDAGVEIVLEALHHGGQVALVRADEVLAEHAGQRRGRRLVAPAGTRGDLWPLALRRFAPQIAQPMDQASLPQGAREADLHGAD